MSAIPIAVNRNVPTKPASTPIAKGVRHPSGKGFAGQFALPGLVPAYVRQGDTVVRYDDEGAARNGALNAMFATMMARTTDKRNAKGYERMAGAELAVALSEADLTPTEFAELYGTRQSRVLSWIDGEEDIPHSVHVLVRLLAYEENYKEARSITDRAQGLGLPIGGRSGGSDGRSGQD